MATKKKTATKKTAKKTAAKKSAARRTHAVDEPPRQATSASRAAGADDDNVYETGVKHEASDGPEETMPGRFYRPVTDIYETGDALILVTDLPGVTAEGLAVHVDRDVLSVHAKVAVDNYAGLTPVHTEYNVGHFARRFRLPGSVDPEGIDAKLADGVLVLELAKASAYRKRRIPVE